MKLVSHISILGALTATAAAAPNGGKRCLCKDEARAIVDKYNKFITHADNAEAIGQDLFADNYILNSDSVNSLLGKPAEALAEHVYTDKQKYISEALRQPAFAQSTTLGLHVVECNKFVWYFSFPNVGGYGQYEVKGFNLFTTTTDRKQIAQNDFEFNSYAWAMDTGYTCTAPSYGIPSDSASSGNAPSSGSATSGNGPSGNGPSGNGPSGAASSGAAPSGNAPGKVTSSGASSSATASSKAPSSSAPSSSAPSSSATSSSVTYGNAPSSSAPSSSAPSSSATSSSATSSKAPSSTASSSTASSTAASSTAAPSGAVPSGHAYGNAYGNAWSGHY